MLAVKWGATSYLQSLEFVRILLFRSTPNLLRARFAD